MSHKKKPERLVLTPEHLAAMDTAAAAIEQRYAEIMARLEGTALPDASQELRVVGDGEQRRWLTRDGQELAQEYVDARLQAQEELRELAAQAKRLVDTMSNIDAILQQQVLETALRGHAILDKAGLAGDLKVPEELSGDVVPFPSRPRKPRPE